MSKFQNATRSAGKLIVLTSHPIQYQAPLWREMVKVMNFDRGNFDILTDVEGGGMPFEVWFLTDQGVRRTEDRDFGKAFAWDVDLLSGYPHRFLELRGKWDMRKFDGIRLAVPIGESLREAEATALWIEGWRFKPFWDAVSAAKKMGIPVFLRGETSDKIAEKGGLFELVRNFALHRLFAKVDYFLAIGQASRRFYLKHGVPEGKLIDAPYGVDNEFFRREADGMRHTADGKQTAERLGKETGNRGQQQDGEIRGLKDQVLKRPKDGGARGAHFDSENFDILTEGPVARREARGAGQEEGDFDRCDFENLTDGQKAIREEWAIPLDAKVVMFCGKFVGKKRPGDVVLAAREHFDRGNFDNLKNSASASRPWHLLFVGSGELGGELRAACDVVYDEEGKRRGALGAGQGEGGVEPSSLEPLASSRAREDARPLASFAGFLNQSEISKAYAIADVVVLPSEAWETWGLVVNEATAAGVPTVVSDRCGCSEDFAAKNPYTRVFPMGDVAAMADAIEEVLALEAQPEEVTKFAEAFSPRITAEAVAQRLRGMR